MIKIKPFISTIIFALLFTNLSFGQYQISDGGSDDVCSGTLTDSGGGGSYSSNEDITYTICSASGEQVVLDFTQIDLEEIGATCYDLLSIYDGPVISATALYSTCQEGSSNLPGSIVSTTGCLTIHFQSDGSSQGTGFSATISCSTCTDGIENGNETGVDCGGPTCPSCPSCFDGTQNQGETGIDCGGPCSQPCHCTDGVLNGDEEDVDCGGSCLAVCPIPCGVTVADPCCETYTLEMYDTYADGWQGSANVDVLINGASVGTFSPADGSDPGTENFTVCPGETIQFGYTAGTSYNSENSFRIYQGGTEIHNSGTGPSTNANIVNSSPDCGLTCAGGDITLTAVGQGSFVQSLNNSFDGGTAGDGWISSSSATYTNPCYPSVDGGIYTWMGDASPAPRQLETIDLDVSCGGDLCFLFAYAQQGTVSPCEGPDLSDEGISLQYSINGGTTWVDITYFGVDGNEYGSNPDGGGATGATPYTAWNNVCKSIPAAAQTSATSFRWIQLASSSLSNDHWGIDNVSINSLVDCTPYIYDWGHLAPNDDPNSTTINITQTTTFNVTYTNGNESCSTDITVEVPGSISLTPSSSDASCGGNCDGSADISVSGATGAVSYLWSNGLSTAGLTGLCGGTYDVTVSDAGSGCDAFESITINSGATLIASITAPGPNQCLGGNSWNFDGSGSTISTGTITDYNWQFGDGNSDTGSNPTHSYATDGSFTITLTVSDGTCSDVTTTSVVVYPMPTITLTPSDASCNGIADGAIAAAGGDGSPAYSYAWSNGGNGSGAVMNLTGLIAGNYIVTLTDASGCTVTDNETIIEPTALSVTSSGIDPTCGGGTNGSITSLATGGTTDYTYSWNAVGIGASQSGLSAGNYTLLITDDAGCTISDAVSLSEPSSVSVSTTITDANCGAADGIIDASASGGTAGYILNWSNAYVGTNNTGLAANSYTLTVTDAVGCYIVTTENVSDAGAPTLSIINDVSVTCFNGSNGSAEADVTGGTPGYNFVWSNGATTAIAANLTAGTHVVTITDSTTPSACVATASINIPQPTEMVVSVLGFNDPSCPGASDGDATLNVVGGTTPYTYNWSSAGTAITQTGIGAGNFMVTVSDDNTCTSTSTVTLTNPPAITVIGNTTDVSCFGLADGTGSLTITGDNGPNTFVWSNGAGIQNPTNFAQGTYTVTVTDNGGCIGNTTITVNEPTVLGVSLNCSNISAPGNGDGSSIATTTGGTTNHTYNWSNGATTSSVNSLLAGEISVTTTDANGCTAINQCTITEPGCAATIGITTTDATCNGLKNGAAIGVMTGGASPYTYQWSDGQTLQTISGLNTGALQLTVTDNNNCSVFGSKNISEPTAIIVSESHIDVTCSGGSNGSINLFASGGTSTLSYNWSNTDNTEDISNLISGNYIVSVTDYNNCLTTLTADIAEPSMLVVTTTVNEINCKGDLTGNATANAIGGITPYSYTWNDALFQDKQTATGLAANTYSVTVTDLNGCQTRANATINEPTQILLDSTVVATSCNQADGSACVIASGGSTPYNYSWLSGTSCISAQAAGTYSVTITDDNGCTESTDIIINNLSGPSISITSTTDVSCFGGSNGNASATLTGGSGTVTFDWLFNGTSMGINNLNNLNLLAGTYTVQATDDNSCIASDVIEILEPLTISYNQNLSSPTCFGYSDGMATVIVDPSSGTSPYTYSWIGETETSETLSGIPAGNYNLEIMDNNNCTVNLNYLLTITPPILITVTGNNASCFGESSGNATVFTQNGVGQLTYNWDGGQSNPNANNLTAGTYGITVSDARGCFETGNIAIDQPDELNVTIANFENLTCFQSCDGWIQSAPSGGVPPYSFSWTGGKNTETITGMCAGVYTVEVEDDNGCTTTVAQTVTEPTPLAIQVVTVVDVSCFGGNDGTAQVLASGGTGPQYLYQWDIGGNLQPAATATDMFATNSACVTATDENGCTISTCVEISQPTPIQTTFDTIRSHCNQNDGQISVQITGGTFPFEYEWLNEPTIPGGLIASNISAGCYTLSITDDLGCGHTQPVCISDIAGPDLTHLSHNDATCNQSCDGIINFNLNGGSTPYASIEWDNNGVHMPTYDGSTTAWSLCGDANYSLVVQDAAGCIAALNQYIVEPSSVISAITQYQNIDCYGGSNGSATVIAGGGTPGYTYSWNSTPAQTTTTATGLTAGVYTVIVRDVNNCMTTSSVTISSPDQLIASASIDDVNCFAGNDGQVCLAASGGSGFYNYTWSNGFNGVACANNLTAAIYSATVTDANGCTFSNTYQVDQPAQLTASISMTDAFCSGYNGTACAYDVAGGTQPYYYAWNDGQVSNCAYGQPEGTSYVVLSDFNGCAIDLNIDVNDQPGPVITGMVTTNPSCFGLCDGTDSVIVTGGTLPLTYAWNDIAFQNTQTAVNLCAGNYCVVVTDANGCAATQCNTIVQPSKLITTGYSMDTIICAGQCTNLIGSCSGGTPGFSVQWGLDATGETGTQIAVCPPENTIYDAQYTCIDANGCTATDYLTVVVQPELRVAIPDTVYTCLGVEVALCADGYGGSDIVDYTFTWSNGPITDSSETSCQITEPTADTEYRVILSDGCSQSDTAYINMVVYPVPVPAYGALQKEGCPPFSTLFSASSSIPNSTFSWDMDGDGNPDTDTTNFEWTYEHSGVYDVILTVESDKGCETIVPIYQYITVYPTPDANFTVDPTETTILNPVITADGSLTTGADSLLFWNFNDGNTAVGEFVENTYLDTGYYNIVLTAWNDYGCFDIDSSHIVRIGADFVLYAPNAFKPTGNIGEHKTFIPKGVGIDKDNFELLIFDRWGHQVFTSNDFNKGWDGTINGGKVGPEGVYIWKVIVKDITDQNKEHKYSGHVTLLK